MRWRAYWRVFWAYRRIWLMRLFEYRTDFYFWSFVSTLWTIFNFFLFEVLMSATGSIAGWSLAEGFILVATFTILDSVIWGMIFHNMWDYTHSVFQGTLDQVLLKPLDTQFLVSTQKNSFTNAFRLLIGIWALWWYAQQLSTPPAWWEWLGYLGLFIVGVLFLYSLWFIVATCAFYVERLNNVNDIVPSMRRIFQMPRSIYTGVFSTLVTVIVPLTLITSLPSEFLIGRGSWVWTGYFTVFTLILLVVSRRFFKFSLKRYQSAGS